VVTHRQAIPYPSKPVIPYSIGLRPLLPGERQQYLEDLDDAVEELSRGQASWRLPWCGWSRITGCEESGLAWQEKDPAWAW
jgi:hypothetical protein